MKQIHDLTLRNVSHTKKGRVKIELSSQICTIKLYYPPENYLRSGMCKSGLQKLYRVTIEEIPWPEEKP